MLYFVFLYEHTRKTYNSGARVRRDRNRNVIYFALGARAWSIPQTLSQRKGVAGAAKHLVRTMAFLSAKRTRFRFVLRMVVFGSGSAQTCQWCSEFSVNAAVRTKQCFITARFGGNILSARTAAEHSLRGLGLLNVVKKSQRHARIICASECAHCRSLSHGTHCDRTFCDIAFFNELKHFASCWFCFWPLCSCVHTRLPHNVLTRS